MNQNTKDIVATLIIISLCVIGIVNGIAHYQVGFDDGASSETSPIVVDALYGIWFKQYTDGSRVRCNATIYATDENNTIYHGKTISDLWGSYDGWSTSTYKNLKPFTHLKFCLSIYVNNTSWNTTDGTYYEVNKTLVVGGNMVLSVWHEGFNHYGYIVMSSLMGTEWWNDGSWGGEG